MPDPYLGCVDGLLARRLAAKAAPVMGAAAHRR